MEKIRWQSNLKFSSWNKIKWRKNEDKIKIKKYAQTISYLFFFKSNIDGNSYFPGPTSAKTSPRSKIVFFFINGKTIPLFPDHKKEKINQTYKYLPKILNKPIKY